MVVFTCCDCNVALKKQAVNEHVMRKCRNAAYVSCVDCGKDFYGDNYTSHSTCITEEQKYGGKNWKPSQGHSKGGHKQNDWLEQVQRAADVSAKDQQLKPLFDSITAAANVPRKKAKFTNFVLSTMPWLRGKQYLIDQVWSAIEKQASQEKQAESQEDECIDKAVNGASVDENKYKVDQVDSNTGEKIRKKGRKHKEHSDLENSTDEKVEKEVDENFGKKNSKKSRKHKHDEVEMDEEEVQQIRAAKVTKKELHQETVEASSGRLNDTLQEEDVVKMFVWDDAIMEILGNRQKPISLTKMRKKILAVFQTTGKVKSENQVFKKLDKHIAKNPLIKVKGDKVMLKSMS